MNMDLLSSKLEQAKVEIQDTCVLSYQTRFNLFVHEGQLHKLFYVYSELVSAQYLLAEAGSFLSSELMLKLEETLNLAFARAADAHEDDSFEGFEVIDGKLITGPLDQSANEIGTLFESIHLEPNYSPYLNQEKMQDQPQNFDRDFLRVYAVNAACSAVRLYLEESNIKSFFFDSKLGQKSIRYEQADAADWYLSYKTGSFKIQNNGVNQAFWNFYIETIIPEASKMENQMGDAANFYMSNL